MTKQMEIGTCKRCANKECPKRDEHPYCIVQRNFMAKDTNQATIEDEEFRCIVCDEPVLTEREGKIHDRCYTLDVVLIVQDDP